MKKYIKSLNIQQLQKVVCLMIILLAVTNLAHADINDLTDPDTLPIDGGLSLLVAAGVGYGAKKVKENRKKKQQEAENDK
jgi:hypothetical protein